MTIGKPLRCYPFKKKDGTFIYLPYDKTEFDLTFIGSDQDLKNIQEYWEAINKPKYDPRKSLQENLTELKDLQRRSTNDSGYWPEPMSCNKIIQTALLEYEEEELQEDIKDYFKMQQEFQLKQQEPKKKKLYKEKNWDDDVPF
tara:strand:- start:735 stop:1163 length:429 start_codon:yes stop_codon:yes gene_type:complete